MFCWLDEATTSIKIITSDVFLKHKQLMLVQAMKEKKITAVIPKVHVLHVYP